MNKLLVLVLVLMSFGLQAQISIIGPASPSGNWTTDHNLTETAAGSGVWTGTFILSVGELKIRENSDWTNNWGNTSFPNGVGVHNGPNIPISPAGTYTITFNRNTLAYSFLLRGKVGVNNTDPQTALDINGGFRTRMEVAVVNNTTNTVFIPLEKSFVWLESATAPFTIVFDEAYYDGARIVLFNGTTHNATYTSHTIPNGKAAEFIKLDGEFRLIGSAGSTSVSSWNLSGNTGIDPNTQFIGTTDNQPIVFKTNNIERMQIESSNEVNELKFKTSLDKKNSITLENTGEVGGDPFGVKMKIETNSNPLLNHGINFSSESSDYPEFNKQNTLHIGADGHVGVGAKTTYGKMTIGHRAIGPYPSLALVDSSETNLGGSILKFRKFDAISDFSIRSHLGPDYEADQSSLRFSWSGYNIMNLRGDGRLGLYNIGNNSGIELGYNYPGKQTDAGKIQYGGFEGGDHILNIVGGGTEPGGGDRKVKIWAEGGTTINSSVSIGSSTPEASAILNIHSTNSGFLPPRMTLMQRNQINAPAAGLIVYNTTSSSLEIWDGVVWSSLSRNEKEKYPISKFCDGLVTEVVPVLNPITNRIWMDRNLGASRAAANISDYYAAGDLYQWGRWSDGHQCMNSPTLNSYHSDDNPEYNYFLYNSTGSWRSPNNDNLWQGVNGINNPCPIGYRIPTEEEWNEEIASWNGGSGLENSGPLKICSSNSRSGVDGNYSFVTNIGTYWSSTVNGSNARVLNLGPTSSYWFDSVRGSAFSCRCIKD